MTRQVGSTLSVDDNRFTLDGNHVDLWGIRTASGTATDAQTDHLIDQLDTYQEYGINAITVFFSGCSGAYYDPFSPDGAHIDSDHLGRMERIIRACASQDIIVFVGIFYQRVAYELVDRQAVHQAVQTVAESLGSYDNIVINIANEHTSHHWAAFADRFDMRDPDRILELCAIVHDIDPDRIVGGGGYHPETCVVIGRGQSADVVLFDTGNEGTTRFDTGSMHDRLGQAGVPKKPLVNVETFGGWTDSFPRGIFPAELRTAYEREVMRAAARPGASLFFHNNPWCQSPHLPMRYDVGGAGTPEDPGIRWYFELIEEVSKRSE